MRNLLLKLAQKYLLINKSPMKSGDLIEHVDDSKFVVECLGIYYNDQLKPFVFFRTEDGFIGSRPFREFRRCADIKRITEGVL